MGALEKSKNLVMPLRVSYLRRKHERAGQIRAEHQVGKWLTFLSGLPSTRSVLEIGTWSGAGSSTLLANAMHGRGLPNSSVIGLEIDSRMVSVSKARLKHRPIYKVVHGRIVDFEDLDSWDLTAVERPWLRQDKMKMEQAPFVLHELPEAIDLCLLDGGEFSSYSEYKTLAPRLTGWLVLDDVETRKNRRVLEEATQSGDFMLVDVSEERNGSAVLKRL